MPPLDPDVADLAPSDPALTAYDQALAIRWHGMDTGTCFDAAGRVERLLSGVSATLRELQEACTHRGADVGFGVRSENLLLNQSIAGFDPKRTFANPRRGYVSATVGH